MHLPIFTHLGAVKILQQFVKSPLLMVKTKVIMLLSYIVNESENDIIHTSDKNIGFIVKVLQNTIEAENHFSRKYGYWAVEIIAGETFCNFEFTITITITITLNSPIKAHFQQKHIPIFLMSCILELLHHAK